MICYGLEVKDRRLMLSNIQVRHGKVKKHVIAFGNSQRE